MLTIQNIVAALRPADDELRILGLNEVIAIAGVIGAIFADQLEVRLALSRLSAEARQAAQELVDCGAIEADDAGRLHIARVPVGGELVLLRRALGLRKRYDP